MRRNSRAKTGGGRTKKAKTQSAPPAAVRAQLGRAILLQRERRFAEALALYDLIRPQAGDDLAAVEVNRGAALRALGRVREAEDAYRIALAKDPNNRPGWTNLGNLLAVARRHKEAAEAFRHAVRLAPEDDEARTNAALSLLESGAAQDAHALIQSRLAETPDRPLLWNGLGLAMAHERAEAGAEACFLRALSLDAACYAAAANLGGLYQLQGRYAESEASYRKALLHKPDHPQSLSGLGQALIGQGKLEQALAPIEKSLTAKPDHLDGHLARARLNLLAGNLEAAWDDYEWRWRRPESPRPKLSGPEWDGSDPKGKTILVHAEQGLGDTIQFARYLPILAARGARVLVAAPAALKGLLSRVPGVAGVLTDGERIPAYDAFIPILGLARHLGARLESLPAKPYLTPPPVDAARRLPQVKGAHLKVGLVWAGSPRHAADRHRSVSLELFAPLWEIPGAAFYSLQTGPRAMDLERCADPALVMDLSSRLHDFEDTAAFLAQLDLLISVDTSPAHLAGGLGRPVWTLLPVAPDWRWMLGREDTPWYPTMRLFRQDGVDDWTGAFQKVTAELTRLAAARRAMPQANIALAQEIILTSAFRNKDGGPRFIMPIAPKLLEDAGGGYLFRHERDSGGFEYGLRRFLDEHLQPGDLFLDVGAHWGIHALQAASRWTNQTQVLAFEPAAINLRQLRRWVSANGMTGQIEIIPAAVGARSGRGRVRPQSTMGFSVERLPDGQGGDGVPIVSLDDELAKRPQLAQKRVILKIDVEGSEPEVLIGARKLIDSGRVAAIIWERGRDYDRPAEAARLKAMMDDLSRRGFSHFRFPHEEMGGPLTPYIFGAELANVYSLAKDFPRLPVYPKPPGPYVAPVGPERSRLAPEMRARWTRALLAAKASDAGRWADLENLTDGADARAIEAAKHIKPGETVLDLGCGLMRLRAHLPKGCIYRPWDLVARAPGCGALDLNQRHFPQTGGDVAVLLHVLEYLHDPAGLLAAARKSAKRLVISYPASNGESEDARRAKGYFNDLSAESLTAILVAQGWQVQSQAAIGDSAFFVCG